MISVIVPVYNAADHIAETIASVRSQTCTEWELILVDDASADTSVTTIRELIADSEERISLITLTENRGAANARNTGIDAAKGRYIAFLDAEDIWEDDKLELTLAFMREKDAAFVFTSYAFGDALGYPTGKEVRVPGTLEFREALSRTVILASTVMIDSRKIAKKWIHMPEIESEDTATWWRIMRKGVTAYGLDEVLTIHRKPGGALASNNADAVKRIWGLYRDPQVAGLGVIRSVRYLVPWALRSAAGRF